MSFGIATLALVLSLAPVNPGASAKPSERSAAVLLSEAVARAKTEHLAFTTVAIDGALLKSPTHPSSSEVLGIRLPPNPERCWAPAHPCWLVLYLPGFDSTVADFGGRLTTAFDRAEAAGAPPMIAVALDPRTNLGGGFYVDSTAGGGWETLLLSQLLPALQSLTPGAPRDHLIVIGHSMGGFGALNLALRHPGVLPRVGALSPVVRPEGMAAELLPTVERTHDPSPLDPAPYIQTPALAHFPERLVWALLAAFDSQPSSAPKWQSAVRTAAHPWHLEAGAVEQLTAFDLVRLSDGSQPALAQMKGIYLSDGRRDRLIPTADVEALAASARGHGAPIDRIKLSIHDGDHIDHLSTDLEAALVFLAQ